MEALILAAGLGSRLRAVEPCKPLTRLAGLSLLEIAARQLVSVGVSRIFVATGFQAQEIEAALPEISVRAGIPIEPRKVADYRQPNGYSVLAGAEMIKGEFLLVMADHIFSRPVLAALADGPAAGEGTVLAIDRNVTAPLIDPDDATWVATADDGSIRHIGKTISKYNAVDCGAFRASAALSDAIRAAIRDGKPGSLSDGMQRLADAGKATTVDIGHAWWVDVDDARMLELARAQVARNLPEVFPGGSIDDAAHAAAQGGW